MQLKTTPLRASSARWRPTEPEKSRTLGVLALLAAFPAAFVGWLNGGAYTEAYPRPFNSERWKTADASGYVRCGMIADLQYRMGIAGKGRIELSRLLGEPDDKGRDPSSSYWSLCPSFMDVWILEVRWRGDRAASAIVRDT